MVAFLIGLQVGFTKFSVIFGFGTAGTSQRTTTGSTNHNGTSSLWGGISSNSCSFCHNNLSVSFVAHLTKFLPKGVIPIFLLNDRCTDQGSSPLMEQLHRTLTGIVLQSISFRSSDEIDSAVTRLQYVILRFSEQTEKIYIFCVCLIHPELVPLIDKISFQFKWVRWVLLLLGHNHSSIPDPALFQKYPVSACKIAMMYEDPLDNIFCATGRCRNIQNNVIIDGPDIEHNSCSQRVQIGKWISKRQKIIPGKSNDFFRFTKRPHFIGREVAVASIDTFPFFDHEYDSNGNLHAKDGIDLKIVQALAQKFNMRLRHVTSSDKRFGSKLSNGSWNGLIGMVVRQVRNVWHVPLFKA
ncbi:uncharacterized protein LOC143257679 [Tachypleus tridentatus]|uniref:uncharacterized protein LOC143257679 n=1 Tax=Tachypleus tridentatus TaxID=6853 RepID=UPI003FD041C5